MFTWDIKRRDYDEDEGVDRVYEQKIKKKKLINISKIKIKEEKLITII